MVNSLALWNVWKGMVPEERRVGAVPSASLIERNIILFG